MKKQPLIPFTKNATPPKAPEQAPRTLDSLMMEYTDCGRVIRKAQDRQEEITVILLNENGKRQQQINELSPVAESK